MKTLYLVRHAKSSWKETSLRDIERPLNRRGLRDAPDMGQRLQQQHIFCDKIYSSPANRAYTTAKLLAHELAYPTDEIVVEPLLYGQGMMAIMTLLHQLDDQYHRILLVSHNPDISQLANNLSTVTIDNLPTCAIVGITFSCDHWQQLSSNNSELLFFDYPKNKS